MIAAEMLMEDGRLSYQGVGTNHYGQQVRARLVGKHDGPVLLRSLFDSGQRFLFPALRHRSATLRPIDSRTTAFRTLPPARVQAAPPSVAEPARVLRASRPDRSFSSPRLNCARRNPGTAKSPSCAT